MSQVRPPLTWALFRNLTLLLLLLVGAMAALLAGGRSARAR